MSQYDALLGTISQDGVPVELGNGINFTGGLVVSRNADTGQLDVDASGIDPGEGGGGVGGITVDLVATSAVTATGLARTIDGVLASDPTFVVLLTAQPDGATNGLYHPAAGAWTRIAAFTGELGSNGKVLRGTVFSGGSWSLSNTSAVTVGTSLLDFRVQPFTDTTGASNADKLVGVVTGGSGATEVTKVQSRHIADNTISVAKLQGSVPNAGKVPVVQLDGTVAFATTPPNIAAKTSLGTALTARSFLRAYDLDVSDDGTNINIQPLVRLPRVMIRGVRLDNITDFEQVTITANGFTLATGDIFEARGQTTTSQNGLYFVARMLGGLAWCYRLSSLEALAADGGLRVYIRAGSTSAGTVQLVTNFTANTRVQQPLTGLRYTEVDVEDFMLSSESADTNIEPAWRRAQEALSYSGGEVLFRRQPVYQSTATFYVKRRIGIRGMGSHSSANGTVINFVAVAGIWGQLKFDMRRTCRSISTTNITLSGTQTVSGVALIAGDRCLVTGQTAGQDNGYYVVSAGAWTRATDFDTTSEADPASRCYISAGTHAGEAWELTTPDPIILGTTPLTFTQATIWVGHEDTLAAQVQVRNISLTQSGTPSVLDTAGGIIARTSFALENVMVSSFSGNGFDFYGSTNAFPASANSGSVLSRCWATGNGLNGFFFGGADANASIITGCNASTNGARAVADQDWGFYDDSFLGNTYVMCEAATNGGAFKAIGSDQDGVFLGCYSESNNGSDITTPNITINCRISLRAGATSLEIPGIQTSTSAMKLSSFRVISQGTIGVETTFGVNSDGVRRFHTVGAGDTSGYYERWLDTANGWFSLHNNTNARAAWGLTGPSHARSYAQPLALLGLLLGTLKMHSVASAAGLPTASSTTTGVGTAGALEGVWATGDVVFNSGFVPGTGLPTHWICTNTAGALTWQAVYQANDGLVDLTAQTASIGSTALLTAPAAGLYEIDYYMCVTTPDAGAVSVQLAIGHTDRAGATSQSSAVLPLTTAGRASGRLLVERASGDITYATTVTTAGSSAYSLRIRARRVG